MTIRKAVQLTDWFLERNTEFSKGLLNPEASWRKDNDLARKMTSVLAEVTERESKILREIRKELIGNCRHPKKMHDICEGQKYCMKCNMDL
ncbi:MAG: hypothetical protein QXN55_02100 [Candidatus Nitrosotenuis sp.]